MRCGIQRCIWVASEAGLREGIEYLEAAGGKWGWIQIQGKYRTGGAETPQTLSWPASAASPTVLPAPHSKGRAPWSQICPGVSSTKVRISADPPTVLSALCSQKCHWDATRYKSTSTAKQPCLHSAVPGSSHAAAMSPQWLHLRQTLWAD